MKSIRGRICHSIYWYAKANNKYMRDYQKDKQASYLKYCKWFWVDQRKISFQWRICKKTVMKKVIKDLFLKLMFKILKNYATFVMIYNFYLIERRLGNLKNL